MEKLSSKAKLGLAAAFLGALAYSGGAAAFHKNENDKRAHRHVECTDKGRRGQKCHTHSSSSHYYYHHNRAAHHGMMLD